MTLRRAAATALIGTLFGLVVFGLSAEAEEKFQKLTGAQIQARFSGMEMTDEVHWGDVYRPGDFWLAPAGRSDIIRQLTVIWGSGFR